MRDADNREGKPMRERRTEGRLSIDLPGTYRRTGDEPRSMFFSQLSSKGCRLSARGAALTEGDRVELHLGPIGPIEGVIRWVGREVAGIEFDTALDAALVDYFAAFINDAA